MSSQCIRCAAIAVLLIVAAPLSQATVSLAAYNVKLDETTVSGISSGAYMAVQFAVAHSGVIKGVGAISGGPYYCAQDDVNTATSTCMIGNPSITPSTNATNSWASSGYIDATSNLAKQKVWLFNGYNDGVVKRTVNNALYNYYKSYTNEYNLYYKSNLNAAHAQITDSFGQACNVTGGDFINNCGYDAAGMILQHLYGKLNLRNTGALTGSVIEFWQSDFSASDTWYVGMSHYGYAYVPNTCVNQQPCRVHIAFHGCKQYATLIGSDYYAHAGYNEWADTNNLIVLYPQTVATTVTPYNPNGCWDWWGYNYSDYAQKSGDQIALVYAMLQRLAGNYTGWSSAPNGSFAAPANLAAIDSGDTRVALAWSGVAGAVGYNIYRAPCSGCAFAKLNASPLAGPSFGDRALSAATTYYYKVRAVNGSSVESADSAVVAKATAAAPPFCDPYHRDNYTHWLEGRANMWYGYDYAVGSGEYMGPGNVYTETDLRQTSTNYYRVGPCS